MTKCVYCKAENRDQAIFCNRCRRPLQRAPRPPRIAFVWILMAILVLGIGFYLISFSSVFAQVPMPHVNSGVEVGKCLIVSGELKLHGGVLQIHVHNNDQVSTCE